MVNIHTTCILSTQRVYVSCDFHMKQPFLYLNFINPLVFVLETDWVLREARIWMLTYCLDGPHTPELVQKLHVTLHASYAALRTLTSEFPPKSGPHNLSNFVIKHSSNYETQISKFSQNAQVTSSAAHSEFQHYLTFLFSQSFTMPSACLYQMDQRALPGNFLARNFCFFSLPQ